LREQGGIVDSQESHDASDAAGGRRGYTWIILQQRRGDQLRSGRENHILSLSRIKSQSREGREGDKEIRLREEKRRREGRRRKEKKRKEKNWIAAIQK